jgi:HD-like signal output (HDOD) protein
VTTRAATAHSPTNVRLPLQPLTARAVLRTVQDPDASAGSLSRLVELDPALSSTVVRMANSPYFGVSGRVAGARQAVVMLGVKTVGSLAVSGTASLVFSDDESVAPPGYWTHSIATAVACGVLAPHAGIPEDEAFTTGLLHDIGSLVLHAGDEPHTTSSISEAVVFGADLLARWGLPRTTVSALRSLFGEPSTVSEPLAKVLLAGHCLAMGVGDDAPHDWTTSTRDAMTMIGLGPNRVDEINAKINLEVERIATFITGAAA